MRHNDKAGLYGSLSLLALALATGDEVIAWLAAAVFLLLAVISSVAVLAQPRKPRQ